MLDIEIAMALTKSNDNNNINDNRISLRIGWWSSRMTWAGKRKD